MDEKEKLMLNHYRKEIETRNFDEYDILGFLIFIRRHLENKYPIIRDFSDLIAHRKRNQGKVMNCIKAAIDNKYECYKNSNKVKGYEGIVEEDWNNEWKELASELAIKMDENILKEITLCIYSLTQKTEYESKTYKGQIDLTVDYTGTIALLTTEGKGDSLFTAFAIYKGYKFNEEYIREPLSVIVETKRKNGKLLLVDKENEEKVIVEI